jgi:hypothetical protein
MTLTGCIAPQQRTQPQLQIPAKPTIREFKPIVFKPRPEKSAAWNYQAQLDIPVFECHLESSGGNSLYRMGIRSALESYGTSLSACMANARKVGDDAVAKFKGSNPSPKMLDLGKDLYAKWSTYIGSMSVYSGESDSAKLAYNASRQALLTEEKFSN